MNRKEDPLWKIARQRVNFRYHLYSFITINLLLWIIWVLNNLWKLGYGRPEYRATKAFIYGGQKSWEFPWPVYIMLIWGIVLFFDYMKTYSHQGSLSVDEEYEKLKTKKDQKEKE